MTYRPPASVGRIAVAHFTLARALCSCFPDQRVLSSSLLEILYPRGYPKYRIYWPFSGQISPICSSHSHFLTVLFAHIALLLCQFTSALDPAE
ncbi:hypothetical protein KC19_VG105500 [Ceratodon purpureus]|uniref:Uncharacterized protein n=1 Tax=Ceratodon purpureus TaxID=3225 RepID=A0A8T0HPN3_CERPU|nr:hypothetical protein KC19_VG105500 [Ceratodon purpureus]